MKTVQIDQERLASIQKLYFGAHTPGRLMCAMEAAAFVAREPWSASPKCVDLVIATFARHWNDTLSDEDRDRLLLPLIPKFIGTRGTSAVANQRAAMAADWLVRVHTPAWLRLAGLTSHADALANLPEIIDFSATHAALMRVLIAARQDAGATANDAARSATYAAAAAAAAMDAARSATYVARSATAHAAAAALAAADAAAAASDAYAYAAAVAAYDAAYADARDAARSAAYAAAYAAARAALAPTVKQLQDSALALLNRMINAREVIENEH